MNRSEIHPILLKTETSENTALSAERSKQVRRLFEQANEHRDYTIYDRAMDAALEAKAASIFPHFRVEEGDIVVDAGSGTGKLAELAAREFRGVHVYALDLSHELQERAQEDQAITQLVYGDATEQNFPDGSVGVKYYSTSGHEIESFGGPGSMERAMQNSFKELRPGGRIVVRDFAKPTRTEPLYMKIISDVGLTEDQASHIAPEDLDYNILSSRALFQRFQTEFGGGNQFSYEIVQIDGDEYIKVEPEWAYEFYMRKDYTGNWRQEIKEKYSYWTTAQARQILERSGYVNVQIIPDQNQYILNKRLKGKVGLFERVDRTMKPLEFPPTHMIMVGEKPGTVDPAIKPNPDVIAAVDYKHLIGNIKVDSINHKVWVDGQSFDALGLPQIGTKKLIFNLASEPQRVLKVVRSDTHNDHNVFKSMYQVIHRQHILEEMHTPHVKVVDYDKAGPPYRYLIQDKVPDNAVSMAQIILAGQLSENAIGQLAEIVNKYEKGKQWQLDTNPFAWYQVMDNQGGHLVYVSGKVYQYDERWAFNKVGLLQWVSPAYVNNSSEYCAALPTLRQARQIQAAWKADDEGLKLWKKYLDPALHP